MTRSCRVVSWLGDVVTAGQQIGAIGARHRRINGDYTPHLHFGVREGRIAEVGAALLPIFVNGRREAVRLGSLGEESIELKMPEGLPPSMSLAINGRRFDVVVREGRSTAPARLLWWIQRPDFPLVGYALTTDGWRDPIRFLREHRADTQPAPLRRAAAR